jgi:hypothetical protein
MNNLEMAIACLYALMVAMSYRKVGFLAALFWPITIVIMGIVVYVSFMLAPPPEQ